MPLGVIATIGAVGNTIKNVGAKIKDAGGVVEAVKGVKVSNAEFNKTREAVQTLFRAEQGGIPLNKPDQIIDPFIIQFKTDPHNVASNKIGANYQQEFGRLYDAAVEGVKKLRGPGAADDFKRNVTRWTNSVHPLDYLATILKGAGTTKIVDMKQDKFAILTPYVPIMVDSLKSKGIAVPTIKGQPLSPEIAAKIGVSENPDVEGLTQLFYNNFVAQKSNYNYENYEPINFAEMHPGHTMHLEEAIVDATISFIKSIQDQKNAGKTLPKVLDKVGAAANDVQGKLTKKAKEVVAGEIGSKVMNNSTIIMVVVGAVVLLVIVLLVRK